MDIIKFRLTIEGWDRKFYEWLDGDGWKHDLYPPMVTNGVVSDLNIDENITRHQYVNLKDKNDKEIYFGDTVKFYYKGKIQFGKVAYLNGMFCLKWADGYINNWQLQVNSLEVVNV